MVDFPAAVTWQLIPACGAVVALSLQAGVPLDEAVEAEGNAAESRTRERATFLCRSALRPHHACS